MNQGRILTIGYGSRKLSEFLDALRLYECEFLVDVRSSPYSRFQPEFSREALIGHLKPHRIRYVFMGDTLGGRPSDTTCYTDGRVDYSKCRTKDFFRQGIDRLHVASSKRLNLILLCSERKPQDCHRSKLIGATLLDQGIETAHIDEDGRLKSQEQVIAELAKAQAEMFAEIVSPLLSRKRYLQVAEHTEDAND